MSQSSASSAVLPQSLGLADPRLYLATAAMVLGNLALPWAVHRIPQGGQMLLPILFFTLIAGWRFGLKAGLLTGLLSPLANHLLTGMPPTPVLPGLLLSSALLGVLAGLAGGRRATVAVLALVVLAHQALTLSPLLAHGAGAMLAGFRFHLPGVLLMILGGRAVLGTLGRRPAATHEG